MPICDICECDIQEADIGQGLELQGGKELKFQQGDKDYYAIRCDSCYDKDKSLRNFQKCEVYSRVCGYIRPVQQWNKAKVAEYGDRINFKNKMQETTPETVEAPVEAPAEEVAE